MNGVTDHMKNNNICLANIYHYWFSFTERLNKVDLRYTEL